MTNRIDTFQRVEIAAHDGDFGNNQRPMPSDKMAMAGNYKVGRTTIFGLPVSIEQPRYSYRTGIDKSGKRWTSRLAAHYGYFTGTKSTDNEPVDCFIGYFPLSDDVYIINQYVNGSFDEPKVMLFFPDIESAKKAYLDSYDKGWTGLRSIVKASVTQLKWWLKYGNKKKPLAPEHLPFDGYETMARIQWDSANQPEGMTIDKLLYEIRRADGSDNLLLDSVSMADILEEAESVMTFDALVSSYAKLERKMNILKTVMERAGASVKPVAMQISDPFKQNGVAQVAVIFELSDGQTITIYFHNPDVTPAKIAPSDDVVSWLWRLNKRDITVLVAPERGEDLNVREVALRMMKLAEKNSALFQRANTKRAEKMHAIESIKEEIAVLEKELVTVQHELEVAKVEAESRPVAVEEIDPLSHDGYLKVMSDPKLQLKYQDTLDAFFQGRIYAVRNALAELGWNIVNGVLLSLREIENYGTHSVKPEFVNVGSGANVVAINWSIDDKTTVISDDPSKTPEQIASEIEAAVQPVDIAEPEPTVTEPEAVEVESESLMVPDFASLDEYTAWISLQAKKYGSKNKFFSSDNYKSIADEVMVKWKALKAKEDADKKTVSAVQYGDTGDKWALRFKFTVGVNPAYVATSGGDTLGGAAKTFDSKADAEQYATENGYILIAPQPQEPNEQTNEQAEVTPEAEAAGEEESGVVDKIQEWHIEVRKLLSDSGWLGFDSGDSMTVIHNGGNYKLVTPDEATDNSLFDLFYDDGSTWVNINTFSYSESRSANDVAIDIIDSVNGHSKDLKEPVIDIEPEVIADPELEAKEDDGDAVEEQAPVDNGTEAEAEIESAEPDVAIETPEASTLSETQENPLKDAFITELNALKFETDANALNDAIDPIMERIEAARLSTELDAEINEALDRLTFLMAEAEKG